MDLSNFEIIFCADQLETKENQSPPSDNSQIFPTIDSINKPQNNPAEQPNLQMFSCLFCSKLYKHFRCLDNHVKKLHLMENNLLTQTDQEINNKILNQDECENPLLESKLGEQQLTKFNQEENNKAEKQLQEDQNKVQKKLLQKEQQEQQQQEQKQKQKEKEKEKQLQQQQLQQQQQQQQEKELQQQQQEKELQQQQQQLQEQQLQSQQQDISQAHINSEIQLNEQQQEKYLIKLDRLNPNERVKNLKCECCPKAYKSFEGIQYHYIVKHNIFITKASKKNIKERTLLTKLRNSSIKQMLS